MALTDGTRLRLLGLVADRPRTTAELAEALRRGRSPFPATALARHLELLRVAGLVDTVESPDGPAVGLRVERLAELGRALDALEAIPSPTAPPVVDGAGRPLPPEDAKVLRSFVADDRLTTIPAQDRKRQVVLRWLLDRCFAEDRAYPEKEVNQLLALHHPDVASLRRYLVDGGHLARDAGIYRRVAPAAGAGSGSGSDVGDSAGA
jgi:DNA-binding transcriptional ArsR family regulator